MKHGEVRIIGGQWRSRKLRFPAIPGLRPTPDSVRETLFNWLAPIIEGANCLDLFAGSGALSFEALSRGAANVTIVDQAPAVIRYLREQLEILKATNATICQAKVPYDKFSTQQPFDIIFLDPPFQKNLIKPTCEWLIQQNLLAKQAHLYIESESNLTPLPIPHNWEILKNKTAGQVNYYLIKT